MRLRDCDPHWRGDGTGRTGMGVSFRAPSTGEHIGVWFSNPIDGGPPYAAVGDEGQDRRWTRSGTTFDDLTLAPSIDVYELEVDGDGRPTGNRARTIWHGHVTNGEVA